MSKERALLERVRAGDDDGNWSISHRLYKDIQELLAQPEPDRLREHINLNKEWYQIGYEKAKQELKRKSLSTKQAEDLWETTFKSAVPYYIFDEIVVAAEQYHDIRDDYE
jgi:hypothetical protein